MWFPWLLGGWLLARPRRLHQLLISFPQLRTDSGQLKKIAALCGRVSLPRVEFVPSVGSALFLGGESAENVHSCVSDWAYLSGNLKRLHGLQVYLRMQCHVSK